MEDTWIITTSPFRSPYRFYNIKTERYVIGSNRLALILLKAAEIRK